MVHMALAIQDLMNGLVKIISGFTIRGTQIELIIRIRTIKNKRDSGIIAPCVHRSVLTIKKNDVSAIMRIG